MQICIVKEALPGVVPHTIIGRSILIGHTTTCIALVAFKDVTLVSIHTPVVPYMGELVVYVPSIDATNASTYIEVVYTSTIIVGVVEIKILYRKDQVRGPPYIRLQKKQYHLYNWKFQGGLYKPPFFIDYDVGVSIRIP